MTPITRELVLNRDNWQRAIEHAYGETMGGGSDLAKGGTLAVFRSEIIGPDVDDDCDVQESRTAQFAVRARPNVMGVCIGEPVIEWNPVTRERTISVLVTVTNASPIAATPAINTIGQGAPHRLFYDGA